MKNSIPNFFIICVGCLISQIAVAQVSRAGLVAEYHLTSGASDSSGQNNNGLMYNVTPTMDRYGVYGNALFFNGTSSYIYVPHSTSLDFTSTLTVVAIVKPTGYTTNPCQSNVIVNEWTANTSQGYAIQFSDQWYDNNCNTLNSAYECFYGASANNQYNGSITAQRIQLNQWYCFAYVQSGLTQKQFVNGVLDYLGTGINPNIGQTSAPLTIGSNSSGLSSFAGIIDEVKVYNRALADSEIAQLCAVESVGLNELNTAHQDPILIWSNPSDRSIHVKAVVSEELVCEVFNVQGQQIKALKSGAFLNGDFTFELPSCGVYFVRYHSGTESGVKKVWVQ